MWGDVFKCDGQVSNKPRIWQFCYQPLMGNFQKAIPANQLIRKFQVPCISCNELIANTFWEFFLDVYILW